MMTLEQIQEALKDRKLVAVAEATGLAYNTVWRVTAGKAPSVSYDVVKKLSDYLERK
jgi:hypothetical protein